MAFPNSIQDLYNQQYEADKVFADQCVDAIKTEINNRIENNLATNFVQDLDTLIGEQPAEQQIRVKDQVVYYFRNIGVRVYIPYGIGSGNLLNVQWLPPNNRREFMKAYV